MKHIIWQSRLTLDGVLSNSIFRSDGQNNVEGNEDNLENRCFLQSPPSPETFFVYLQENLSTYLYWVSRGISFNRGEEECLLICARAQFS